MQSTFGKNYFGNGQVQLVLEATFGISSSDSEFLGYVQQNLLNSKFAVTFHVSILFGYFLLLNF